MNPKWVQKVLARIPVDMMQIPLVGEVKADHLFNTMFKRLHGHSVFAVVFP